MIIRGDARRIPLADKTIQTCITSPPYWGLRDYGIEGQIGLEPTPEAYVATMVKVFREVWRVLRDDGTLWLNLGDSYAAGGNGGGGSFAKDDIRCAEPGTDKNERPFWRKGPKALAAGLKPKDLCGIPWRVAFALQADGWYLRSDIIWAKPNPMPESVTDRPTRGHDYLFLLAKSERYFYDAQAIMEPASPSTHARIAQPRILSQTGGEKDYGEGSNRSARRALTNLALKARGANPKSLLGVQGVERQNESFQSATADIVLERNKRDVWTINSEPTPEAHFATFPQRLVEPCILAGSRVGDIVLDPFLGSGTVGKVAERLGRHWVGLELSQDYINIAEKRTAQRGLMLG